MFMRSSFIIPFILLFIFGCNRMKEIPYQNNTENIETEDAQDNSFTICGPDASIDLKEWQKYLHDNLVLDSISVDTIPAGTYITFIQFVIDERGKITDVSITKDSGYGLGQRTANVISQYKGRWKPAQGNEYPVKSYRRQPVTFIVEEEKCNNENPDFIP